MLSVGRELVTEIWVGSNPVGLVQTVGMEVWPNKPVPPWQKTFVDVLLHKWTGSWRPSDPDLTDKPTPVKGSIVFSVGVSAGSITVTVTIHDGTQWIESPDSFSERAFCVDLLGSSDYQVSRWFNTADGATDYGNFMADPVNGPDSSKASFCAYAAPDGIHICLTDKNGSNPTNFIEPYPAGVTQADMPPTQDFT